MINDFYFDSILLVNHDFYDSLRRLEAELLRPGPPGFEMTVFKRDMRLIK